MTSKEIGIEDARKRLGDYVTAAQQGTDIILTRNGRPAARLTRMEDVMSFSLMVPGGANMALSGEDLIDAVDRNFEHIAKALRVHQRGGYVLQSVTLSRGEGKLGDRTYAELTIKALPAQDLPKQEVTDRIQTFTGYIFAKPDEIPAEPHEFQIG